MAGKVTLLLWGAQTTQLLVEPPWRPAVLWDRVTLTCQGAGTAGATTWYKDGQRWWQQGKDRLIVTLSGTYECDRPGSGLSPAVNISDDWLVLQVPVQVLLEGDTVTLRCRSWRDNPITSVSFYHEDEELEVFPNGTQLSLSRLRLNHSGRYRCKGQVGTWGWKESALVTVTVQVPVAHATITPDVLEVTPHDTVAAGVSGALLFLLLLMGVIVAWHRWNHVDARKHQQRAPQGPLELPVEDPQATYMELQRQPLEPSDIYDNLHQKL
ncbi:low affinity immunoglobulin gamma Fc region receptor III-like [Zonotrichia albicollis]|uniref:low affinity immunoglobulin gamma Fc region receptor III-like n=1 Tax=Zonotrichia albicollis TaxID=44394 RepID=UPI003D80BB60